MKILVRVDSSREMGSGHLMRCLSLADALRERGVEVLFLTREHSGNLIGQITRRNFDSIVLPTLAKPILSENLYESWLGVSLTEEISQTLQAISKIDPDWTIVDHYGIPSTWETEVRRAGTRVMVIDDLYRNHDCDAVLNQNYDSHAKSKLVATVHGQTQVFAGPEYALLNKSFRSLLPSARVTGDVKKTLIFFGGSDPTGETLKLLNAIVHLGLHGIHFDIVAGSSNPHIDSIRELSQKLPSTLYVQTDSMHQLMYEADLFIGAGGSTTWERCYYGLPSLCVAIADNQREVCQNLHRIGVHQYLGTSDTVSEGKYREAILKIVADSELRSAFSVNSLKLGVHSRFKELLDLFGN